MTQPAGVASDQAGRMTHGQKLRASPTDSVTSPATHSRLGETLDGLMPQPPSPLREHLGTRPGPESVGGARCVVFATLDMHGLGNMQMQRTLANRHPRAHAASGEYAHGCSKL